MDDLSLEVRAGEVLGVMGPNGAGKTTVLRLLARVTEPDAGHIATRGRLVSALELGVGFHTDLSGRQNISTSGLLLGMADDEVESVAEEIIAFAGLGSAIDDQLRTYSAGMRARLGFALAIHAKPDILLLDELLAVGDEEFRHQAVDAVGALCDGGSSVVLVSHDVELLAQMSTTLVSMASGRCRDRGPVDQVLGRSQRPWWGTTASLTDRGIRIDSFDLARRHVPAGGTVELTGSLTVEEPSPSARMELTYRVRPEDPHTDMTPTMLDSCTMFHQVVEPAGGVLNQVGRRWFRGEIDRNFVVGAFDVVVTVVDGSDEAVVAESWRPVTVGAERPEGFPANPLEFTWDVELVSQGLLDAQDPTGHDQK